MSASTPTPVTRIYKSVVASGGTLGTPLDLGIFDATRVIVGIVIQGVIISTTMTFNVSHQADGVNFFSLINEAGSAVSITIASNSAIGTKQDIKAQLGNWRYIQPIMGSSETNGATIWFDVQ